MAEEPRQPRVRLREAHALRANATRPTPEPTQAIAQLTRCSGEFVSRAMDAWAFAHDVRLEFIRPGKPVENAFVESFNARLRDECVNRMCSRRQPTRSTSSTPSAVDYNEVPLTVRWRIGRPSRWHHCRVD